MGGGGGSRGGQQTYCSTPRLISRLGKFLFPRDHLVYSAGGESQMSQRPKIGKAEAAEAMLQRLPPIK